MPVLARLVIAMGLGLPVAAASAQSLGEVAKKTGAERKGTAARKLTDKDLPAVSRLEAELRDFRLTEDEFWRYSEARQWVLDVRASHPNIDEWLAGAEREDAPPPVIEAMLAQEPLLSSALDRERILPHAYVLVEVAFNRAVADATRSDEELSRMPPARADNALFVRNNPRNFVKAAQYHWGEKQKKLEERRRYRR